MAGWGSGCQTEERECGDKGGVPDGIWGLVWGQREEAGMVPGFPTQASRGSLGVGRGAGSPEMKSPGGGAVTGAWEECGEVGRTGGLTFHGDFPAACQVRLVAHQDDGHMVRLMCAPQLYSELGGALEAASVRDGVHDDVGTARLQARLLAPALVLWGRHPGPCSEDT